MSMGEPVQPEDSEVVWDLADRIHKIRREFQMGQEEFGAIFGVSGKAVSTWETGTNKPRDRFAFANKVADEAKKRQLNIPAMWVLGFGEFPIRAEVDLTVFDNPDPLQLRLETAGYRPFRERAQLALA